MTTTEGKTKRSMNSENVLIRDKHSQQIPLHRNKSIRKDTGYSTGSSHEDRGKGSRETKRKDKKKSRRDDDSPERPTKKRRKSRESSKEEDEK